jgi:hypothetical protein
VAASAVLRGDRAKCDKHESVMLNLSDQWGRVRKTLNEHAQGWGSRPGVIRPRRRALGVEVLVPGPAKGVSGPGAGRYRVAGVLGRAVARLVGVAGLVGRIVACGVAGVLGWVVDCVVVAAGGVAGPGLVRVAS